MTSLGPNIATWIDRWAGHQPDALAVEFEGEQTSYSQLANKIGALANWLVESGIEQGDRVAWLGPNHPFALELVFACSQVGAITLPLNSRLLPSEHRWILEDAEVNLVVSEDSFCEAALEAANGIAVQSLSSLVYPLMSNPAEQKGNSHDPLLLAYTSGTTGTPKGALLTQSALIANAINSFHCHDFTTKDRVLTFLPLFHVGGLNIQTIPALLAGASVLLHRAFDPGKWLRDVEEWRPTWSLFVPATLDAVAKHPDFATADLSSLNGLMAGSSTIPEAVTRPFFERGIPVGQVYGSTETAPTAVIMRVEQAEQRPTSCGKPATLCSLRIVDDEGHDVSRGQTGELWIKGPNILAEYWRNPEATRESITDGWFHTGDIGHVDEEGWVYIDDRKKDLVISGGENIYPAELENVLAGSALFVEAAVVGIPDDRWGEIPIVVAAQDSGKAQDSEAVLKLFAGQVAPFKVPKKVFWVDALPRNVMGKVLKHEIRDMLKDKSFNDHPIR